MIEFCEKEVSYHGFIRTLHGNVGNYVDPEKLFRDVRTTIYSKINTGYMLHLRLIICICVVFQKVKENEMIEFKSFYFCSKAERILSQAMIYKKNRCGF